MASLAKTGCAVVAEEHSVYGGLCSAVSELCAESQPTPLEFVAVRDRFGKSGEFEELMAYFGLDAASIVQAAKKYSCANNLAIIFLSQNRHYEWSTL